MNVVYEACAGLDVHKRTVVACATVPDTKGQRRKERRTFSTMTPDLVQLRQWLTDLGVTHVAMESTASYWKPVYNVLEGHLDVLVVNAQHLKAITTDSPQWKHSRLDSRRRGDRSDPCVVRPAIAVA
jgi:transposase